jgi:hypothetical protein
MLKLARPRFAQLEVSMTSRRFATVGFLVLVLAGAARADDEVRGVIVKVDASRGEILLEGRGRGIRGEILTFLIVRETRIRSGKQEIGVEQVPVGKRARIRYENQDGQRVALAINVPASLVAGPNPGTPPPVEDGTITGTLQRVAFTDREIVVVAPGPGSEELETTFAVPENAAIAKDGKPLKLEDLHEGEAVAVRPEKRNGKVVAASIQVGAKPRGVPPAERKLERIRQALRLADWILGQLDDSRKAPKP